MKHYMVEGRRRRRRRRRRNKKKKKRVSRRELQRTLPEYTRLYLKRSVLGIVIIIEFSKAGLMKI